MKVAVTGAGGFIGGYVIDRLLAHGEDVTGVDRDFRESPSRERAISLVELDIADIDVDPLSQMLNPDVVIHLAWGGLPDFESMHHLESELPLHEVFLKRLVDGGLRNLTVAGTCFEYGMRTGCLYEDMETEPSSPYGRAKDLLRQRLQAYQEEAPFQLTWCRLFYMYGDRQPAKSIFPQLRDAASRGDETFPMSGGQQIRDYLSVEAVANSVVTLALRQEDMGVVNVCSGRPVSMQTLVETWIRENGWEIKPEFGVYPYADYEPMEFWGDASKLRRLLDDEA